MSAALIGHRDPPVFAVRAVEVTTRDGQLAIRIETMAHVCIEYRLPRSEAIGLANAIYIHQENLPR